jgi:hypothetical protein
MDMCIVDGWWQGSSTMLEYIGAAEDWYEADIR